METPTSQTPASRLAARRTRITKLRKRFIAGGATVFVAVWIGIFGQLVSGHDPALAARSSSGSASSSQAVNTGSASSSIGSSGSGTSSSGTSSGSSTASPVTTRQS
ncbi:MAG TPA: hypothetical protein VMU90_05195 [Solirubrobacteraceae bacterium]|nr:hypothetical protein [Solirubrobacteraceae bacterium]